MVFSNLPLSLFGAMSGIFGMLRFQSVVVVLWIILLGWLIDWHFQPVTYIVVANAYNHAFLKFVLQALQNLTHYQKTNFRLFQPERVCRQQFQIWRKWRKLAKRVENTVRKRRNCSLRAISPFPTVFSKGLFPRGIKRCHCVGMG